MQVKSINDLLKFNEDRVVVKPLLESSFSKEVLILMKEGQIMREHKTPFPIIIHILEGAIKFGVEGSTLELNKGDIITLEGNVPHDLTAQAKSMIRLTLSKLDKAERVEKVVTESAP